VTITLRVESENWLAAAKAGLQKVGGGELAANILCDIQADGSIHVTDPAGARVFRIRELQDAAAPAAAPPAAPAPLQDPSRTAVMHPPPPPAPATAAARTATLPVAPRAPAPSSAPPTLRPSAEARPPAPPAHRPPAPSRPVPASTARHVEEVASPREPQRTPIGRVGEGPGSVETLADVFFRAADVSAKTDRDEGLRLLLDLAMEKIHCDAGSVLLGRYQSDDLAFAVARGPKAEELRRLRLSVPHGKGIVGVCARENVCLAVSDAEKDARFYRAVAEAIGYATRSALCAPISAGGRVRGAMELINKSGGPFSPGDLAVLSYVAHKAGEFLDRVA
jgi:hypothetical protein